MSVYTVHRGFVSPAFPERPSFIFIKEGIAVPFLMLPEIWLVYHRLWFALLVYLGTVFSVMGGATMMSYEVFAFLCLSMMRFWLAFEVNDIRRFRLEADGFQLVGIVEATSLDHAEIRFFSHYDGPLPEDTDGGLFASFLAGRFPLWGPKASAGKAGPVSSAGFALAAHPEPDVLGLFPAPHPRSPGQGGPWK